MSEYASVNKLKSLKQNIESLTGESYADLTTAVQALKDRTVNADKVDGFHISVIPKGGTIPTDRTICFVYGG